MLRNLPSFSFVEYSSTPTILKSLLAIFLLFTSHHLLSQEMIRVDIASEDPYHFYLNDQDSTNLFYYKIVPEEEAVGVLTILPSGGETIENLLTQITLHEAAWENNLLVVIPSYNWGTIQRDPEMDFFDTIFKQIVEEHKVSKDNFIFCGLSNGGMFSLEYGIRSIRDSSTYLVPRGIIGLDPPLDLSRFYHYCEREIERNFSPAGVGEAKWLKGVYEQVFGGSPDSVPMRYQEASTFTFGAPKGGNTQYLRDIAIRMQSDLNIDFLVNQRKRDLYDWNGTDIVAFVNQLKINGNEEAEVIITQNKGKRPDGSLNPHSWSIMDTDSTITWILDLLNQNQQTTQDSLPQSLSKTDYLADFDQLVDSIRTHHPQPYEFISKKDFDALVHEKRSSISDKTDIRQFSLVCMSISAAVGCLHTNISAYHLLALSPDMFFPMKVRYLNSKLYLIAPYEKMPELNTGVEITEIKGMDVQDLKREIARHISADGYNQGLLDEITNEYFSYFCSHFFNFPSAYEIVVDVNGEKQELLINQGPFPSSTTGFNAAGDQLQFTTDPSESTAILTIKSFSFYDEQLPVFKSFIDSCFRQIDDQKMDHLIIDLRDNGGGDPYCAVHLLQYISDQPFRYYKEGSTVYYQEIEQKIKPFKNAFQGNLYVLINSFGASTTGHLCSILKHKKIGTLVGSETGATYSCNADAIQFELKNTTINASVATRVYETDVKGFEKNRGIVPDYPIEKSLEELLAQKDLEMEKVMELIKGD